MGNSIIEKVWKTEEGFKAWILNCRGSHYCGYVGVPKDHPLHGLDYNTNSPHIRDITGEEGLGQRSPLMLLCGAGKETSPAMAFDVHGGVTFAGTGYLDLEGDGLWYFGFDCAHYEDGSLSEWNGYEPKSIEFCVEQCESLAKQIVEKTL